MPTIPVPGTPDYTAYRGSFIATPLRCPARRAVMSVPPLDLLPECPITGSRFAKDNGSLCLPCPRWAAGGG